MRARKDQNGNDKTAEIQCVKSKMVAKKVAQDEEATQNAVNGNDKPIDNQVINPKMVTTFLENGNDDLTEVKDLLCMVTTNQQKTNELLMAMGKLVRMVLNSVNGNANTKANTTPVPVGRNTEGTIRTPDRYGMNGKDSEGNYVAPSPARNINTSEQGGVDWYATVRGKLIQISQDVIGEKAWNTMTLKTHYDKLVNEWAAHVIDNPHGFTQNQLNALTSIGDKIQSTYGKKMQYAERHKSKTPTEISQYEDPMSKAIAEDYEKYHASNNSTSDDEHARYIQGLLDQLRNDPRFKDASESSEQPQTPTEQESGQPQSPESEQSQTVGEQPQPPTETENPTNRPQSTNGERMEQLSTDGTKVAQSARESAKTANSDDGEPNLRHFAHVSAAKAISESRDYGNWRNDLYEEAHRRYPNLKMGALGELDLETIWATETRIAKNRQKSTNATAGEQSSTPTEKTRQSAREAAKTASGEIPMPRDLSDIVVYVGRETETRPTIDDGVNHDLDAIFESAARMQGISTEEFIRQHCADAKTA